MSIGLRVPQRRRRLVLASALLALAVALVPLAHGLASADSDEAQQRPLGMEETILQSTIEHNPGMTPAQAAKRAADQPKRMLMMQQFAREFDAEIAGSWMPLNSTVLVIGTTTERAASRALELAKKYGVEVEIEMMKRSMASLDRRAAMVAPGNDPVIGELASGWVESDIKRNILRLGVIAGGMEQAQARLDEALQRGMPEADGVELVETPPDFARQQGD